MISGYKKLTGRYLKASKKRTALTIIGIVLSVALISSIGLFFHSLQVSQVEDAKRNFGAFHLLFQKVDEDLASKITSNPKVSRYGFFTLGDEVTVGKSLVLSELMATDKALELMPYRAKAGRLPEKEKEAAVEKWTLSYIDKTAKIGDKIKFNNKEYELVGILEDNMTNQIDNKGVILSKNNNIDKSKSALAVEISSKTRISTALEELKALAPKDTVLENAYLLMMMGVGDSSSMVGLYLTLFIIIGIVVISTVAVIYNSFQISVVERIKQFGLLRAVGATPKQIRKIVFREATVLALIGVPIGLLLGIIAIYAIGLAFKIIGGDSILPMRPSISPMVLLISAVVGVISIYLSALVPASFAGRISPLVAISSRNSITKEKIKKRKNRIMQKIFGFEGALASKNIKRSRKRYRITVFSIVISVVLFITFKSFMDMTLNITSIPNESKNVHFSVIRDSQATTEDTKIEESIVQELKDINTVDKVYRVFDNLDFEASINKDSELKEIRNMEEIYKNNNDKTIISSSMAVYDKEALETVEKYLTEGSLDLEKFNKENGVIIIARNKIFNSKTEKVYNGPVANLKAGDEIEVKYLPIVKGNGQESSFGEGKVSKVKVMGIVNVDPFNFRGSQSGLKIITSVENAQALTEIKDIKPVNLNIVINDVNNEEKAKTEIEKVLTANPSLYIVNLIDINRNDKTSLLMMQILIYGFIIVVSLIGSVNIINTLTTNIILRKREFAALKSIGLTQKGLKKMITLEGLLYGIVGTLYGSIIGSLLSYLLYIALGEVREFPWTIPWNAIAIAGSAALIIGYLSVLAPLSRIKKENLIEAIREEY